MNPDLYKILLHIHSVGRWVLLVLLVIAIFNSMVAGKRPYLKADARTGLILTIVADLMLIVGLVQWYFGGWGYQQIKAFGFGAVMKEPVVRFFAVEHLVMMVLAIVCIHIGKAQGRKAISDGAKHKRTMLYYLVALVLILISIPWPFRHLFADRHWF